MIYDGSRGENFGKLKIKDNTKLTNKEKETLTFDIGYNISEEDIVDHIYIVYYQNKEYWVSNYCNEIDVMLNSNKTQSNVK